MFSIHQRQFNEIDAFEIFVIKKKKSLESYYN